MRLSAVDFPARVVKPIGTAVRERSLTSGLPAHQVTDLDLRQQRREATWLRFWMNIEQQIERAKDMETLIRVYRAGLEDGWASGYVVGIGPSFFVLELIDNTVQYDGFNCFRYSDVTRVESPDPHAAFIESALKLRGYSHQPYPALDLASPREILLSAGKAFPVVTIHIEQSDPDVCFIGKVIEVSDEQLALRLITPDAAWETELEAYDLEDITRIDFGGQYEGALVLVAEAR